MFLNKTYFEWIDEHILKITNITCLVNLTFVFFIAYWFLRFKLFSQKIRNEIPMVKVIWLKVCDEGYVKVNHISLGNRGWRDIKVQTIRLRSMLDNKIWLEILTENMKMFNSRNQFGDSSMNNKDWENPR